MTLRLVALDVLVLFAGWTGVAVLCRLVGLPSSLYFVVGVAFAVLSLPGWFWSQFFRHSLNSLPYRFYVAAVISFVVYGDLAFLCYALGWGFDAFYLLFAVVALAAAATAVRAGRYRMLAPYDGLRPGLGTVLDAVVGVSVLVLLACFYRTPHSNDLQVFLPNMVDHQVLRSFQPSMLIETVFGLDEPIPRAYVHLFHVFPGLLGDAIGVNVVAVSMYLATIPLGVLMFASLFYYLRSLAGPRMPVLGLVVALLAPITIFYLARSHARFFDLHYHLFNSSVVDKSFALFFVLPALLFLTVSYLRSGLGRYLVVLCAAMPMIFYFHPLTGVYYFMSAPVLLLAFLGRVPRSRLAAVAVYAAVVLAGTLGRGDQERDAMHALLHYDFTQRDKLHYWPGSYLLSGISVGGFRWVGDTLRFWPHHYLSAFVVSSAAATLVWLLFLPWRSADPDERISLRAQLAYLAALAACWVGGEVAVNVRRDLYEALERLHWMYLGFLGYAFVVAHLLDALATRLRPGWARQGVMAVASLLLVAHVATQVHALNQPWRRPRRDIVFSSYAVEYHGNPDIAADVFERTERGGGRRALFRKPEWLRDGDRIYQQTFRDFPGQAHDVGWGFVMGGYPLMRQLVYFPQLGHEGEAYHAHGDAFFARFNAYYDGQEGKVTPRLVEWLEREGVTVIISPDSAFVARLVAAMGRRAEPVAPDTYRLAAAR